MRQLSGNCWARGETLPVPFGFQAEPHASCHSPAPHRDLRAYQRSGLARIRRTCFWSRGLHEELEKMLRNYIIENLTGACYVRTRCPCLTPRRCRVDSQGTGRALLPIQSRRPTEGLNYV